MHESYISSLLKIQIKSETRPFLPKWRDAQPTLLGWRWYLPKVSHEFLRPYTHLFGCAGSLLPFCSCGKRQLLSGSGVRASRCSGFSCGAWVLRCVGSQHTQLWHTGMVAPQCVGSSLIRDWTCIPCIGKQILYHWAPREAQLTQFRCSLSVSWLLPVLVATDSLLKSVWSILKASWTQQACFQVLSWGFGLSFQVPSRKCTWAPYLPSHWKEAQPTFLPLPPVVPFNPQIKPQNSDHKDVVMFLQQWKYCPDFACYRCESKVKWSSQ